MFLTSTGSAVVIGRPADFKNTMRHINTRAVAPFLQVAMTLGTRLLFNKDLAPQWMDAAPVGAAGWKHVACSNGSLTALVDGQGVLYTFGSNNLGQCGHGERSEVEHVPKPVVGFEPDAKCISVALGFEHALAVTDRGWLYSWGRGDRGTTGHGDTSHYKAAARVIGTTGELLDVNFVCVEASLSQSYAVDAAGRLWTWGKMASSEVSHAQADGHLMRDQRVPRLVLWEDEAGVVDSDSSSAVEVATVETAPAEVRQYRRADDIAAAGGLVVASDDVEGEEAHEAAVQHQQRGHTKRRRKVAAISAGHAHCSILTDDGCLWMTGLLGRGLLFDDSPDPPSAAPTNTSSGSEAAVETAGTINASLPAVAAQDSLVPATTGISEVHMQVYPLRIPAGPLAGQRVVRLRSSLHHTYAVTADGKVYRWGWKGVVQQVQQVEGLRVADIAHGFVHTLVLAQ